jgi:hypothetical protein
MHYYKVATAVTVLAVLGIGTLSAQPDTKATGPADVTRLMNEMEDAYTTLVHLQAVARAEKDVVKLNCVNENLMTVKALIKIAENSKGSLESGESGSATDDLAQLQSNHDQALAALTDAQSCVGEDLNSASSSRVTVSRPAIQDDATNDSDPFDPTTKGLDIERPAFATPW